MRASGNDFAAEIAGDHLLAHCAQPIPRDGAVCVFRHPLVWLVVVGVCIVQLCVLDSFLYILYGHNERGIPITQWYSKTRGWPGTLIFRSGSTRQTSMTRPGIPTGYLGS